MYMHVRYPKLNKKNSGRWRNRFNSSKKRNGKKTPIERWYLNWRLYSPLASDKQYSKIEEKEKIRWQSELLWNDGEIRESKCMTSVMHNNHHSAKLSKNTKYTTMYKSTRNQRKQKNGNNISLTPSQKQSETQMKY